jgi:large subunit ribosomal protein L9
MKIILTQDVDKLGNAGTLQEVKPGYARNYLIPKGMAVVATTGMVKQVNERQAAEQRKIAKQEVAMQSLADRISGMRLTFTARAGDTGRLYGSVTNAEIAEKLSLELGEEIDRRKIEVPGGIHQVGDFTVIVNLVGRLKPQITAVVVAEGAEETEGAMEQEASAETDADSAEATEADETADAATETDDETEAERGA